MTNIAINIGVQEYQFFPPLKYTANDAKKMRDFLLEEAGFDYVFYFSDAFLGDDLGLTFFPP